MTTLNLTALTDVQKDEFVSGWKEAGGYMGDVESPAPWCAPWTWGDTEIEVSGDTPQEWGASWWYAKKPEVLAAIAAEAAEEGEDE